ncbi:minor tail protein [Mycobacterium phage Terror]|uniref:Minor tail protein n=1 Tax=Mycobacterium phage Taheera TaxID=1897549 RepID=A0A1D8EVQ2_9CAUD|nr:minor tail protein [Mycobacterium phage Taheera]AOT25130.1 minor tail protein [Mycobacterium phage Taheera]AOT25190.1 minor tail protein [Mycobacterium phage Terror]
MGNSESVACQSCGTVYAWGEQFCGCGADLPQPEDDRYGRLNYEIPPDLQPAQEAIYVIDQMLDNPVDIHGNHYDLRYLKPVLAFHLARCGLGLIEDQAVVKRREYPNGFVEWVKLDAPDLPPDPLDGLSLADIAKLPAEQRDAAIRRLQAGENGPVDDPDDRIPWKVRTNIQIDEEALK